MAAQVRTLGWTTWITILVVVVLILIAGLLFVAQ